jgi:hypothetical protein
MYVTISRREIITAAIWLKVIKTSTLKKEQRNQAKFMFQTTFRLLFLLRLNFTLRKKKTNFKN